VPGTQLLFTLEMRYSWNIARCVDVGSACVDRGQSPLTYLLLLLLLLLGHITCVCCYRRSSVVCLSVCLSLVTFMSPANTAESIQMPIGE